MSSRKRTGVAMSGGGGRGPPDKRNVAIAINAKMRQRFPYGAYGNMHVLRGSGENLARFGPTWKEGDETQRSNRKAFGYSGKGKYSVGKFAKDFRTITGVLGTKKYTQGLANIGMGMASAAAGPYGGAGLYTGHGAYVHSNNLVDGVGGDMIHRRGVPSAQSVGDETGAIVVTHREYITDIFGPPAGVAFNNQTYNLNPGLEGTFPFLSQIACNYDEYEFVQVVWEYRSTTTDIGNSSTGQCGTVIMCTNYNAAAAPFPDKGIMMEYAHAHSCKVTEHMVHGVECDPHKMALSGCKYTRSSPVITNQDIKTYDLGLFQLAVANSPPAYANLPIGELWVQYSVVLRKPKLFSTRGLDVDKDEFVANSLSTLSANNWFGVAGSSNWLEAQQNNIGVQVLPGTQYAYSGTTTPTQLVSTGAGCSLIIPAGYNGNLRISIDLTGTVIATTPPPVLLGNINLVSDLYYGPAANPASSQSIIASGQLTSSLVFDIYVRQATGIAYSLGTVFPNGSAYSGGNNIISFGGIGATTVTYASIQVEQYQPLGGILGLNTTLARVPFVNQSNVQVIP